MKWLDAAKLERVGRLVCGPLWQSELARTMGVSRQTVLRWAAGEFHPRLNILPRPKGWCARGSGTCSAYSKRYERLRWSDLATPMARQFVARRGRSATKRPAPVAGRATGRAFIGVLRSVGLGETPPSGMTTSHARTSDMGKAKGPKSDRAPIHYDENDGLWTDALAPKPPPKPRLRRSCACKVHP